MGKGWAKGLTAETDARVARVAEGHRGRIYAPRIGGRDLRALKTAAPRDPVWSSELAYVVGLTATDGCLITGRRRIDFKSKDRELVELYLSLLGRTNAIVIERTRHGGIAYKTQLGDSRFYRWLVALGLSSRKSLTLGALIVPDEFLIDVARGLLDGDGSIINKVYRADTRAPRPYYWEYLLTRFCSASEAHLVWLADRLRSATACVGRISEVRRRTPPPGRHPMFHLTYGKRASTVLLPLLYAEGVPCLERKRVIWLDYAARHSLPPIG